MHFLKCIRKKGSLDIFDVAFMVTNSTTCNDAMTIGPMTFYQLTISLIKCTLVSVFTTLHLLLNLHMGPLS
jgi:hypothetical protein